MNSYTPLQFREAMKVLHCLSVEEFYEMMGRNLDQDPGDYIYGKWQDMKNSIFNWMCALDEENLNLVFKYAEKKRIWYELKRVNV